MGIAMPMGPLGALKKEKSLVGFQATCYTQAVI